MKNSKTGVNYKNETTKENYKLSTCIRFNENTFSAVSYQEYQKGKLVTFNYITNLKVSNYNRLVRKSNIGMLKIISTTY